MALADLDDTSVLDDANILIFDIETIPAVVTTYDLRTRFIPHRNVIEPGGMLCWAAQWYHEPHSVRYMDRRNPDMLATLWDLLDSSSYTVTFNGDRFDLAKVRGYFAREGMPPPRPSKSIDLIKTARTFGFESASLDYSCRMFGVRRKVAGAGASGWADCLAGDERAWRDMRRYSVGDVRATTELFDAMRPWIRNHPYMGFAAQDDNGARCPRCGSSDTERVGVYQAVVIRYNQHRCRSCSGLYRSSFHHRAGYTHAI